MSKFPDTRPMQFQPNVKGIPNHVPYHRPSFWPDAWAFLIYFLFAMLSPSMLGRRKNAKRVVALAWIAMILAVVTFVWMGVGR